MKVNDLDMQFTAGGYADIALPGARLHIRGREGACPGELDDVVFLTQVHGAEVLCDPEGGEKADGMIITDGSHSAGIRTADCLPVFMKSRDCTAAFHAGWRGLANGIAARMIDEFPGKPDFAVFGNCICSDCYEVGEDVRKKLLGDSLSASHPPGRIDLKKLTLHQMISAGLPADCAVYSLPQCTCCRSDLFHSYRRNRTDDRNLQWIE